MYRFTEKEEETKGKGVQLFHHDVRREKGSEEKDKNTRRKKREDQKSEKQMKPEDNRYKVKVGIKSCR